MSPRRDCPERDRPLKTLARALIAAAGGLEAAACVTRVNRSRLAEYQDMTGPAFMPADVGAALEEVAGEPLLTRELARRAGYALVPLGAPPGSDGLAVAMAEMGQEVGEAFAAHAAALRDGQVSEAERARIFAEAQDVMLKALAVMQACKARTP